MNARNMWVRFFPVFSPKIDNVTYERKRKRKKKRVLGKGTRCSILEVFFQLIFTCVWKWMFRIRKTIEKTWNVSHKHKTFQKLMRKTQLLASCTTATNDAKNY